MHSGACVAVKSPQNMRKLASSLGEPQAPHYASIIRMRRDVYTVHKVDLVKQTKKRDCAFPLAVTTDSKRMMIPQMTSGNRTSLSNLPKARRAREEWATKV